VTVTDGVAIAGVQVDGLLWLVGSIVLGPDLV